MGILDVPRIYKEAYPGSEKVLARRDFSSG